MLPPVSHLWYFAYGSNMSPGTFLDRRHMRPVETRRAFIDGYRLCFDIPVGPGERGVANLIADGAARTHGIAYLLTVEDAERLDRTEGVPNLYQREIIDLRFDERATAAGFTYRSTVAAVGRKPSARYLDILLHGARTYGLPDAYITYLESLELAFDERIGAVRR
jgi:cation transport regulator ChaC